jgi:formate/nitrite transporter FocA (FNT family)
MRLWSVVLAGNLIGTAVAAWAFNYMPVFDEPTRQAFVSIAEDVMKNSPTEMFANAIISGWLVATMVWMFPCRRRQDRGDHSDDLAYRPGGYHPYRGGLGRDPLSGI